MSARWDDLDLSFTAEPEDGHPIWMREHRRLRDLHLVKSGGYGTAQDAFANFTFLAAKKLQPRHVYACDRIVEKVARIYSLTDQGRFEECKEDLRDMAALALCALSMLIEDM